VRQVDFAEAASEWLRDAEQSEGLARFILRLLPEALTSAERSGLRGFLAQRLVNQIEATEVAPLAAELMTTFTEDRRHQRILDEVLLALNRLMTDPATRDAIRQKIRAELPTLLNLYRADKFLLKKIATSAFAFLEEVRADENHPLRHEFDRFVASFVEKIASSPEYAAKLDTFRRDLLADRRYVLAGSPLPSLPYRPSTLGRLAAGLITQLGHKEVDVAGVPWGGGVAQQCAHQHSDMCRKLVLAASSPGAIKLSYQSSGSSRHRVATSTVPPCEA
jgi:Protein of unknown function (DUF445)